MIHIPRPLALTLATLVALLALNHTAQACPYLICKALEINEN